MIFSEDCLITSVSTPKEFKRDLESIPEEEEWKRPQRTQMLIQKIM